MIFQLNGEDVTSAPHQQVVHMVVTAPDTIVMKVVTAPNIRGQEALEKLGESTQSDVGMKKICCETEIICVYLVLSGSYEHYYISHHYSR